VQQTPSVFFAVYRLIRLDAVHRHFKQLGTNRSLFFGCRGFGLHGSEQLFTLQVLWNISELDSHLLSSTFV
jgi:hypothetical protein